MRKVLLGSVLLMSLLNNLEVSLAEVEILPDQTFEELEVSKRRLTKDEIDLIDSTIPFVNEAVKLQTLHERFNKSPNLTEEQTKKIKNVMEELEQLQKEMNDHLNRG